MERTSVIQGTNRILLVAPHGADDTNTAELTELVAKHLGAFAVINRGWRRSKTVDAINDLANCNDVRHLHEDVVREEFLIPIRRSIARIGRKHRKNALMIVVHGCKDQVKDSSGDEMLDMIVGYGAGNPPSHSCSMKTKNALVYCLQQEGFGVFEGAAGGLYAGRAKNNLNQLFVRWTPDIKVESLQLEIVHELRNDLDMVEMTAEGLISALDSFLLVQEDDIEIEPFEVGRI